MGGHKTISCRSDIHPVIIPPPPDFVAEPAPVCFPELSGNYYYAGEFNFKPYYKHQTEDYFIWYDEVYFSYCINMALGETFTPGFFCYLEVVPGYYYPDWGAFGNMIIT